MRSREWRERKKKEKVSIFTVAVYIFADDEQSLEADDFRKRASSTREIMFLSRASLPRLQVRSQSKRQRTGSGALFRCSKSRESLISFSFAFQSFTRILAPLAPASATRQSSSGVVVEARRPSIDEIGAVKAPKGVLERGVFPFRRQSTNKLDPLLLSPPPK